jgi:hypothetical protein
MHVPRSELMLSTHQETGLDPNLQQLVLPVSLEQSAFAVQRRTVYGCPFMSMHMLFAAGGVSLHDAAHDAVSSDAVQLGTVPPLKYSLPQQNCVPHWPTAIEVFEEPAQSTV